MKRLWAAIGLAITGQMALAQSHANDWVDYDPSRTYLEVRIAKTGLYRIDDDALSTALDGIGIDLNDVDPRSIQALRPRRRTIHPHRRRRRWRL